MKLSAMKDMHVALDELGRSRRELNFALEEFVRIEEADILINPSIEVGEEDLKVILQNVKEAQRKFGEKLKNVLTIGKTKYTTEYKTWAMKNKRVIAKVENMSTDDVRERLVDVPSGMHSTYLTVISTISSGINAINVERMVIDALKTVDSVQASIANGSKDCEKKTKAANTINATRDKEVVKTKKAMEQCFLPEAAAAEKQPFGKAVGTIKDLKDSREVVGAVNEKISNQASVHRAIGNLEEAVGITVDYLTDTETREDTDYVPSPDFIKNYTKFIGDIERHLATYGELVLHAMAVTHNLTFVYKTLEEG